MKNIRPQKNYDIKVVDRNKKEECCFTCCPESAGLM